MNTPTQTATPAAATPPSSSRKPRSLKAILGWFALGVFLIIAGLGAGRGESKGFQVDADAGRFQSSSVAPGMKRLSQELQKGVRKARFRVRWQDTSGAKPVAYALHYDRDEDTLDYYRDTVWKDGYNDLTDSQIVIVADKGLPLPRLVEFGAKRAPAPK